MTNLPPVPCVIFGFNRPSKLEKVLAALKEQHIDHLIIFIDGPRGPKDEEPVAQCHRLAKSISWIKPELYLHDQNQGLLGLLENIDLVFKTYQVALFVEDDCMPMPGFYTFMQKAVRRYATEKRVFSIGGYQPLRPSYFWRYPYSLVSTWRFTCWGWATWRDRWHTIQPYLPQYAELFDNLRAAPDIPGGADLLVAARACAEGKLESWATRVAIVTWCLGMVHLLPTQGLIRNIGLDTGTHAKPEPPFIHNRNLYKGGSSSKLWLENIEPNQRYDYDLEQFHQQNRQLKNYYRAILRKISTLSTTVQDIRKRE